MTETATRRGHETTRVFSTRATPTRKARWTLFSRHRDHLGSLVSATDPGGNELGWARYFPFGALRLSGGSLPSDRLFTGQTRDLADDRRYWFKARAYDAAIGQFQSPDLALPKYDQGPDDRRPPNGPDDPLTLDRYAYALNSPLRLVDPTGRYALDPADHAGSGFGDFAFGGGLVPNTVVWTIDAQGHPGGSKGFNRELPSWQGVQEFCTLVSAASLLKYYGATGGGQDLAVAIAQTLGKLDVVWPSPNGGGPPPHGTTPNVAYVSRRGTQASLDLAIEAIARAHGLAHLTVHTEFGYTSWPDIESALRAGHPVILNVFNAPSGVPSHSVIAYDLVRGNLLVSDTDFPGQSFTWSETAAKLNTLTVTFIVPGQQ